MSDQSFRISFDVIAFAKASHLSPQRIEERMQAALERIILDETDPPQGEVFGYIQNIQVTKND